MKNKIFQSILVFLICLVFATQAWSENILYSDTDYSIKIAVTINNDDYIMGILEYSNHVPQFPIQIVTFNWVGGNIHAEPYVFQMSEKIIVSKNVHAIKCRPLNDKYGSAEITGTIDFSNEIEPKVHLINGFGHTYISNISEQGKKYHMKYIPNVWLGH